MPCVQVEAVQEEGQGCAWLSPSPGERSVPALRGAPRGGGSAAWLGELRVHDGPEGADGGTGERHHRHPAAP